MTERSAATDQNAEIERITYELELLRERYAAYVRWGGVLRIFFMIWVPLFGIVVAALFIRLFIFDAFMGGFFGALALVIAFMCWLARDRRSATASERRLRWIDRASLPPSAFRWGFGRPEAQMVEEEIAVRERRLAELRVAS
jgi:hypothetical protein